jgi:hypothetical protein
MRTLGFYQVDVFTDTSTTPTTSWSAGACGPSSGAS